MAFVHDQWYSSISLTYYFIVSKWTLNTQTYNLVRIHLVRDSHTYKYIGIDIDQWIRYISGYIYIYEYTYNIYIYNILYRYISESVVIVVPSNTEKEI